jgi:N-methylhydantoinase B/oxoprolinase/acetone carboxylase alpha subunit
MRSADAILDVIEVEVVRNALAAAAAEMDVTIWRTSRSTVVRELLDYSTAVFDADGYNVAQSARIPQHLNSMGAALRTLLDRHVDAKSWGPGDVVVTNDLIAALSTSMTCSYSRPCSTMGSVSPM